MTASWRIGVAAGNELVGLADVLAFHQLRPERGGEAELVHRLGGGEAVGRGLRVGDGQVPEAATLQHLTLGVDVAGLGRPECQGADGIGEARAGHDLAFLLQFRRSAVVGGEENLERRAVLDLRIELAGGAVGGDQPVPGVFLEFLGDGLDRRGEVGRDGDLHLVGAGGQGYGAGEEGEQ